MAPIHDLTSSTALFSSSLLSLTSLLILSYIHFIKKISRHVLVSYLQIILISDLIYTSVGVILYYGDNEKVWSGNIGAIRSYFRLVSIATAFELVAMIKMLGISEDETESKQVPKSHLLRIFIFPFIIVTILRRFSFQRCVDVICFDSRDLPFIDFAVMYLQVSIAIFSVFWHHYKVITELNAKWGRNNTISVYDLRELWNYPTGLLFCYIWLFIDTPLTQKNSFITFMNIFGQQGQGWMHCLVYGMSYETRSFVKKWIKDNIRKIKFFHKTKNEENRSIELQTKLMRKSKSNHERDAHDIYETI